MMGITKAVLGLFLLSTTPTLTSGSQARNKQCPYTKDTGKDSACFKVELSIEGLSLSDVCVGDLEVALVNYHNAAIDCACPKNKVTYTGVNIISIESGTVVPEDPGRRLFTNFVDVEYSVRADCGFSCPTNPLPGSPVLDSSGGPFFRHLASNKEGINSASPRLLAGNRDDSECFEDLFVESLNEDGFEVTGVTAISTQKKPLGFCASTDTSPPSPSPTPPSPTPPSPTPPSPTPPSPTPPTDYTPKDCKENNPCNVGNTQFYFTHRHPRLFVQCDEFGECFEQRCPTGMIWSQDALVCVERPKNN